MEDKAVIDLIGNEVFQMEQVSTGNIGQQHTHGDGEQEQGLEFLDDGQVY